MKEKAMKKMQHYAKAHPLKILGISFLVGAGLAQIRRFYKNKGKRHAK